MVLARSIEGDSERIRELREGLMKPAEGRRDGYLAIGSGKE